MALNMDRIIKYLPKWLDRRRCSISAPKVAVYNFDYMSHNHEEKNTYYGEKHANSSKWRICDDSASSLRRVRGESAASLQRACDESAASTRWVRDDAATRERRKLGNQRMCGCPMTVHETMRKRHFWSVNIFQTFDWDTLHRIYITNPFFKIFVF